MADNTDRRLVRMLVFEEIERIVADASNAADVVHVNRFAERLRTAFPNSGMSPDEIADQLALAAVSAGLAVEINRREAAL